MVINKIGDSLRAARLKSGLSVKEVSTHLISKGIKALEKTIYSWENSRSQPTPDALLLLCKLYGITDVLSTFGFTDPDQNKKDSALAEPSSDLQETIIQIYRKLSPDRQEAARDYLQFLLDQSEKESK